VQRELVVSWYLDVSVSATGDFGGTTNGAAAILDGKF
jgi:hypothetical protein